MAVKQIAESFQNDGNFSQLDLQDQKLGHPKMRIETFRCSQPESEFGTTLAGTEVKALCGLDHLAEGSNHTFRHLFSVERENVMNGTLEIRESYNESGDWSISVRDIDFKSESYGSIVSSEIVVLDEVEYKLTFSIFSTSTKACIPISSPLTSAISRVNEELSDIKNGEKSLKTSFQHSAIISLADSIEEVNDKMAPIRKVFRRFKSWNANIQTYLRFGDFRDKCVHDGTNLTGENVQLASEYILIRAYRASLIELAAIGDPEMHKIYGLKSMETGILSDPKPGIYTPFLSAYYLNIGIYRLGLDKVHSDYGGIPMKKAPGSKLETGIEPVYNSDRANRTLADLAAMFFQPQLLKFTRERVES